MNKQDTLVSMKIQENMNKHNKNKNNLALISEWIINSMVNNSLNIMTGLLHEKKN